MTNDQKNKRETHCELCGMPRSYHTQMWIDGLIDHLLPYDPAKHLPRVIDQLFSFILEKLVLGLGLAKKTYDFPLTDITPRSRVFIEALKKKGIRSYVLSGVFGYSNQFGMHVGKSIFRFEGLPTFNFGEGKRMDLDDKMVVKRFLEKNNFPHARGKTFWFWQKENAVRYAKELGYPVVVKPENGSVARHVSTNIKSDTDLLQALKVAYEFSPVAILEKQIEGFVHRVTVVAGKHTFCVKQLPAHVVGDGVHTIDELVKEKNDDPKRGPASDKRFLLHTLLIGPETEELLARENLSLADVPESGRRVYLRRDPFMRFGGDLEACTETLHPDNVALCEKIAQTFGAFLVGMDFILPDASRSYKEQPCAILELNGLPCIDMHHYPSYGKPDDVAGILLEETLKKLSSAR